MKINPDKTEILLLCPPALNKEVVIKGVIFENTIVSICQKCRSICWYDLNLDSHVNFIVSHCYKILKIIGRINRVFHNITFLFLELAFWPWSTTLLNRMLIFSDFLEAIFKEFWIILAKYGRSSNRKISSLLYLCKYTSYKVFWPHILSTSIAFVVQCINHSYLRQQKIAQICKNLKICQLWSEISHGNKSFD